MERKQAMLCSGGVCLLITLCLPSAEYSSAAAQGIRPARKIDEYQVRFLQSHDEQMRLWSAFDDIKKESDDARLFIIAYSPLPGSGRRHANRVKNYVVNGHGLIPSRITTIDGGYRAERSVEVWIVPNDAQEPVPQPSASFKPATNVAWKYDEYSLDGWWFASDFEWKPERLDGFAAALQAHSGSKGYIVVHRGTMNCETCLTPGTEYKFARQEKNYLVKKHQIAPSRITIIRGGSVGGGRIELWVVPSGTRLPRANISFRPER